MIGYEFENGSDTLFATIRKTQVLDALKRAAPALQELTKDAKSGMIVPRRYLFNVVKKLDAKGKKFGKTVHALLTSTPDEDLDRSISVLEGGQHGDLHTKNILIGPKGPVLIDFAHYRSKDQDGIPLLDLAKLAVDLWAFGEDAVGLQYILSSDVTAQVPRRASD